MDFKHGIIIGMICMFLFMNLNDKCFISNSTHTLQTNNIKTLVRQSARWSTAAKQDESSMIAVLHANYGAGYLWALKDIYTDEQIKQATGIDVQKFAKEITSIQDYATKKMTGLCPRFAPKSSYLTSLAGEGV